LPCCLELLRVTATLSRNFVTGSTAGVLCMTCCATSCCSIPTHLVVVVVLLLLLLLLLLLQVSRYTGQCVAHLRAMHVLRLRQKGVSQLLLLCMPCT
jgi:hypothetical protein